MIKLDPETCGWTLFSPAPGVSGDHHVIPDHDIKPHITSGECVCQPFEHHEGDLNHPFTTEIGWFHNAFDGREAYESKVRKPN